MYSRRALEVSLEFKDQRTMGYAYSLLSAIAKHEQRPAEAERYSRQALAAFIEIRDLHNMSLAYQRLGDALWDQGSQVEALKAMLTGVMLWSQATGTLALDRMGPLREVRAAMADEIVQELLRTEVPEDLVGDLLAHLAEPQD